MSELPVDPLRLVARHLDWFCAHAPMRGYGSYEGDLWIAALDLRTGRHPERDRAAGVAKRCYRFIEAPWGGNAYWDLPLLAACHAASARLGEPRWAAAADACIAEIFTRCRSASGLLLWGNHYYVDARSGDVLRFDGDGDPHPIDARRDEAELHETRPLPVPWRMLHRVAPEATAAALRAHDRHLADVGTGAFNRHADRAHGYAFCEAGGILCESLCWLEATSRDAGAGDLAERVARFSYARRHDGTGLVPISPTIERWDRHACTSEIGLWAGSLLRAADRVGRHALRDMGCDALAAWLEHAWDPTRGRFRGRVAIVDGRHQRNPQVTAYQPGTWSDPWEPLFPAHDYPMPCAEACLAAWRATGDARFRRGIEHWVRVIDGTLPARNGAGAYAEHYGRAIHFLMGAAEACSVAAWRELAARVAVEALVVLGAGERLRSHPREERCDAVDGMGFLLLALLGLAGGRVDDQGLGW